MIMELHIASGPFFLPRIAFANHVETARSRKSGQVSE